MKFLDSTGFEYFAGKLAPINGKFDIPLPDNIYNINQIAGIRQLTAMGIIASQKLKDIVKRQHCVLQFYTSASSNSMVLGPTSKYMGCGYYVGNGVSALDNSKGVIQAYIFPSQVAQGQSPAFDFKIFNKDGTLTWQ